MSANKNKMIAIVLRNIATMPGLDAILNSTNIAILLRIGGIEINPGPAQNTGLKHKLQIIIIIKCLSIRRSTKFNILPTLEGQKSQNAIFCVPRQFKQKLGLIGFQKTLVNYLDA